MTTTTLPAALTARHIEVIFDGTALSKISGNTASVESEAGPAVYASRNESALRAANRVLYDNGYAPLPIETKIIAPNLYAIRYMRNTDEFMTRDTFELRLARHMRNPIPLTMVSITRDGSNEYHDSERTIYDPESQAAREVAVSFMVANPTRGHFWLPRFALPPSRQD